MRGGDPMMTDPRLQLSVNDLLVMAVMIRFLDKTLKHIEDLYRVMGGWTPEMAAEWQEMRLDLGCLTELSDRLKEIADQVKAQTRKEHAEGR